MDKKLVVIADTDEEYITALEYKLIEEWNEDMELHIISQLKYFNEFFNQPRSIYMLLVNEFLYNDKVKKQNCNYVFILREDEIGDGLTAYEDSTTQELSKYSSIKEIYAQIMSTVRRSSMQAPVEHTKMYMVYSPVGGCGKTLCALGLCEQLAEQKKRVLYINMETIQSFDHFLDAVSFAKPSFAYALGAGSVDLKREVLPEIGSGTFDYLKPLEKAPLSYQIKERAYMNLAETIQAEKLYDMIVLEVSGEFHYAKVQWMDRMDKIFVVCMADETSAVKVQSFLKNIVCTEEKFLFICNRLKPETENYLSNMISLGDITVCEYIEEFPSGEMTLEDIRSRGILKATAYMLE